MRIFGRERETLKIKKVRACRAVYQLHQEHEEIEIELHTEDGEKLTLQLPFRLAPQLVQQLTIAHEAINPPMRTGSRAADWAGMMD